MECKDRMKGVYVYTATPNESLVAALFTSRHTLHNMTNAPITTPTAATKTPPRLPGLYRAIVAAEWVPVSVAVLLSVPVTEPSESVADKNNVEETPPVPDGSAVKG